VLSLVVLIAVRLILPIACLWARRQESFILKTGIALSAAQVQTARKLCIVHPDRVRLRAVLQVPPLNPLLRFVGSKLGMISGQTIGMTLRYGIYIREGYWGDRRLLVHELAHVAQYERMGGFWGFLGPYLQECINPGYPLGELEQEAKRAEAAYG
jgi:hypothetical protein